MAPTPQQIKGELDRREFAKYVLTSRQGRGTDQYFTDWKDRIDSNDRMYRGEWEQEWPDGIVEQVKPMVMNIFQTALDDFGRLVMEVQPQIRCVSKGDSDKQADRAYLREAILQTYAEVNDVDELNHQHALDLGQTGVALEAITFNGDDPEYPLFTAIDPRGAYPRFANNRLVDLIVVQRMEKELVGPAFNIDLADEFDGTTLGRCTEIEVIDYYDSKSFSRVLVAYAGSKTMATMLDTAMISRWEHNLGKPCVAWARLKSGDRGFRGFFDQLKGSALAQNRIVNDVLAGIEQMIYAPFQSYDVENDTDPPGPRTIYRRRSPEGGMTRVQAGGFNPEVLNILSYLERQTRAGANYPESRQGEVSQSIASASFVSSTMGNLTTMIKGAQKEIGRLWRRRNSLAFEIDEKFGAPGPKPLLITTGDFSTYRTSDIGGDYSNSVVYGAGAGLDALNKKAALAQDVGLGITSKKTAREQTDYQIDPRGEEQEIEKEAVVQGLMQRLLTDPNVGTDLLMNFAQLLAAGKSMLEAAAILAASQEQERAAQQMAQQQAAAAAPGAPGIAPEAPMGMQNPEMLPGAPPTGVIGPGRPQPAEARPLPTLESMVARMPAGG